MKGHTTLTVDTDLVEEAKRLGINLSANFNDMLKSLVNKETQSVDSIDLELEVLKKKKLSAKLIIIQTELKVCIDKINTYNAVIEKRKQDDLLKEKEAIEKTTKCINCGGFLDEKKKSVQFNGGKVCSGCYMTATSEQVKKWNQVSNGTEE